MIKRNVQTFIFYASCSLVEV